MKKLFRKLNSTLWSAKLAAKSFIADEHGDTNFVSIAIILVVVIVIAILFITLGQDLATKLGEKIRELMEALG